MNIERIKYNCLSFGYKHPLKKMWLKGELPSVKYGLYGDKLTKKNVSLEHIQCHCKNGTTTFDNLALASKQKNNLRGNQDIKNFLDVSMIKKYLNQYVDVVVKRGKTTIFEGNEYINNIIPTFKKLGFKF